MWGLKLFPHSNHEPWFKDKLRPRTQRLAHQSSRRPPDETNKKSFRSLSIDRSFARSCSSPPQKTCCLFGQSESNHISIQNSIHHSAFGCSCLDSYTYDTSVIRSRFLSCRVLITTRSYHLCDHLNSKVRHHSKGIQHVIFTAQPYHARENGRRRKWTFSIAISIMVTFYANGVWTECDPSSPLIALSSNRVVKHSG